MRWMLAAVAAMGLAGGALAQQAGPSGLSQSDEAAVVALGQEAVAALANRLANQRADLLGSLLAGQEHAFRCSPALAAFTATTIIREQIIARAAETARAHPATSARFDASYAETRDLYMRGRADVACSAAINSLGIAANYLRAPD
jgi:hypothetical protein